jgi:hypothetical protein
MILVVLRPLTVLVCSAYRMFCDRTYTAQVRSRGNCGEVPMMVMAPKRINGPACRLMLPRCSTEHTPISTSSLFITQAVIPAAVAASQSDASAVAPHHPPPYWRYSASLHCCHC